MNVKTVPVGLLGTNCYIAYSASDAVIIDPGAEPEKILNEVEQLGVAVSHIFLTHAHFDHVLAAREIVEQTGAVLCASKFERERLCDKELSGISMIRRSDFTPLVCDVEIEDGDVISVGDMNFKFVLTPGHTEGSMCIFCDDTVFSGDTLFAGSCGRCDLSGGSIGDMLRSLKMLYEIDGDFKVLPGHGGATTLEYERKRNPYIAEAIRG